MKRNLGWIVVVLLALGAACAPSGVVPAGEVRLEGEVLLDPEESGLLRSMLGMVTHPDGSIYVNTQTQQRLYKSVDQGRSWTRAAGESSRRTTRPGSARPSCRP